MFNHYNETDTEWLPLSDLMSGLMIIFLFISSLYIQETKQEEVVKTETKVSLVHQIQQSLTPHLADWNAQFLDSTLTIRFFSEEEILFDQGAAQLSPFFKSTLDNFFVSYFEIIENFQTDIKELRIEGHTSSEGSYFNNMQLSQNRANQVLHYLLYERALSEEQKLWLQEYVSSNGMGEKEPIRGYWGQEDSIKSRRVEFEIVLQ